jgi:hypothetical protein
MVAIGNSFLEKSEECENIFYTRGTQPLERCRGQPRDWRLAKNEGKMAKNEKTLSPEERQSYTKETWPLFGLSPEVLCAFW